MPKKGSLKTPTPPAGEKVVSKGKKLSLEQKIGHEIDEIFPSKKKRKNGAEKVEKPKEKAKKTSLQQRKPGNEIDEIFPNKKKCKNEIDDVVKPEEPTLEQKNPGNEIDEIFSSKKKKKTELEEGEKLEGNSSSKRENMKKRNKRSKASESNGFVDPPSRPRRKTNDGLTVYSAEELGISKSDAGGTPLCPFDCTCCF